MDTVDHNLVLNQTKFKAEMIRVDQLALHLVRVLNALRDAARWIIITISYVTDTK